MTGITTFSEAGGTTECEPRVELGPAKDIDTEIYRSEYPNPVVQLIRSEII